MAPEQVRRQQADARTDIFACGVMLYEMLARRRPFAEETAAETMTAILRREPTALQHVDAALPDTLARVVERCLRKRPEDRFHSAHDLALALEASLSPTAVPVAAAPLPALRAPLPRRRHGTGWALAAMVTLVVAANVWWQQTPSGKESVAYAGVVDPRLVRYDATERRFEPFLSGLAAEGVDVSRDGQWITYTTYPAGELWRSRVSGADPRRLTTVPLRAALPRWSPDGTRIAFAARAPGRPWQVYVVPAEGGPMEILAPENVTDPGWTSDGRSIVMGAVSNQPGAIFEWDLESRRQTVVPGSHGLFSPRPSPDGRYLVALDAKSYQLALRDQRTGTWSRPQPGGVSYPAWSRDSSRLYVRRHGGFSRIDPATGREETVAALDGAILVGGEWGAWSGLGPDDTPLVLVTKDPVTG